MLLHLLVLAAATESWGLKWKAPPGCIEPAQLARAVEGRLGFSVFGAGAKHRIDGELTRSATAPRWRASFVAVDAEGSVLGSRELTSDDSSCRALDDKLVMVVSVMIDPRREAPPPEPEVLPPPPPAPPREPPPIARADADPAAKEEYEKRLLHFGDWVAVNQTGQVVAQGSSLYEGKYMKPLTVVDFYERLGETERVEQLKSRGRLQAGLAIPAAVLVLGGLTTIFVGIFAAGNCEILTPGFDACIERRNAVRNATLWAGTGASIGGGVLLLASLFIPHPIDKPEVMREKADRYNRRLRQELGLEPSGPVDEPRRPPPNPQASLQLAPQLVPGGGGLLVTLAF